MASSDASKPTVPWLDCEIQFPGITSPVCCSCTRFLDLKEQYPLIPQRQHIFGSMFGTKCSMRLIPKSRRVFTSLVHDVEHLVYSLWVEGDEDTLKRFPAGITNPRYLPDGIDTEAEDIPFRLHSDPPQVPLWFQVAAWLHELDPLARCCCISSLVGRIAVDRWNVDNGKLAELYEDERRPNWSTMEWLDQIREKERICNILGEFWDLLSAIYTRKPGPTSIFSLPAIAPPMWLTVIVAILQSGDLGQDLFMKIRKMRWPFEPRILKFLDSALRKVTLPQHDIRYLPWVNSFPKALRDIDVPFGFWDDILPFLSATISTVEDLETPRLPEEDFDPFTWCMGVLVSNIASNSVDVLGWDCIDCDPFTDHGHACSFLFDILGDYRLPPKLIPLQTGVVKRYYRYVLEHIGHTCWQNYRKERDYQWFDFTAFHYITAMEQHHGYPSPEIPFHAFKQPGSRICQSCILGELIRPWEYGRKCLSTRIREMKTAIAELEKEVGRPIGARHQPVRQVCHSPPQSGVEMPDGMVEESSGISAVDPDVNIAAWNVERAECGVGQALGTMLGTPDGHPNGIYISDSGNPHQSWTDPMVDLNGRLSWAMDSQTRHEADVPIATGQSLNPPSVGNTRRQALSRTSIVKSIKNYLINSLSSHNVILESANWRSKLPWTTLPSLLERHGLKFENWPKGVPFPGGGRSDHKGINGLTLGELTVLQDAMNDAANPLAIVRDERNDVASGASGVQTLHAQRKRVYIGSASANDNGDGTVICGSQNSAGPSTMVSERPYKRIRFYQYDSVAV